MGETTAGTADKAQGTSVKAQVRENISRTGSLCNQHKNNTSHDIPTPGGAGTAVTPQTMGPGTQENSEKGRGAP